MVASIVAATAVAAAVAAAAAAATAAAAMFFVVFLTLAVYIVRLLSTASRLRTLHPLDHEQQCPGCGVPFRPIRANQLYCGRACRDGAAATRRKNRLEALSRPEPSQASSGRSLS